MKILMLVLLVVSCGKKESKRCVPQEEMVLNCEVVNTPTYGRPYAHRVCSEQYSSRRCW